MRFQKQYNIEKWTNWHHNIHIAIKGFYTKYNFYPNILEANKHTYSQIDFLVSIIPEEKEKIVNIETLKHPEQDEMIGISSFQDVNCLIDFAVNEKLKDKYFKLIYDSNPDWGDDNVQEIPIDVNKNKVIKVVS